MTKRVRIENADNSKFQLVVELIEINMRTYEETVISTTELRNPTDLVELNIWSNRYIRVREKMPE